MSGLHRLQTVRRAWECVFDDIVNELAPKFREADGLVVARSVYYASANATLIAVLDSFFLQHAFWTRP